MLCLAVVGVYVLDLGIHFNNCGSLHVPIPDQLVSLGIDVDLEQEGLDTTLVLDDHKESVGFLSKGQLLVIVSLACYLNAF